MPFRLDYIEVRYQDGERERTALLIAPLWTSIGEMNRIVSKWAELLRECTDKARLNNALEPTATAPSACD